MLTNELTDISFALSISWKREKGPFRTSALGLKIPKEKSTLLCLPLDLPLASHLGHSLSTSVEYLPYTQGNHTPQPSSTRNTEQEVKARSLKTDKVLFNLPMLQFPIMK